jgi:hypothetical protein
MDLRVTTQHRSQIKAIKQLRYDHPTFDLYGEEILPVDRLSIVQDKLLLFKIRNGLIKHIFEREKTHKI